MRLKVLSEVFNAEYTADIKEISDLGHISYQFKDEKLGKDSPTYTVSIDIEELDNEDIGELIPVPEFLGNKFRKFKKKEIAEVTLKWQSPGEKGLTPYGASAESFKTSNLGNQYLVYSKMLACLEQYTRDYGSPLFIEFTGSDDKMELVYERMLKQQAKLNPKLAYVPYSHGIFIHLPVVQYLKSKELDQFVNNQTQKRSEELEKKRAELKRQKAIKMGPSSPTWTPPF